MNTYNSYSELKFAREQGLLDRSYTIRLFLAFFFVVGLLLFLHFREIRVDRLELGTPAPHYIVTQVDVNFLDDQATAILKQAAASDLGKIWKISRTGILKAREAFEQQFPSEEGEVHEQAIRLEKVLQLQRFTDARTFRKMRLVDFSTEAIHPFVPRDPSKEVFLPRQAWESIAGQAFPGKSWVEELQPLFAFFEKRRWHLEEDPVLFQQLYKKVQAKVGDQYTHVRAGTRIIDQGERVTARHLAILQAMKEALSKERNLTDVSTVLGSVFLTVLLTAICLAYLQTHFPDILRSNRKLCLVITIVLLTMVFAKMTELFLLGAKGSWSDWVRYPLFVPFAAILLCSLLNPVIATFASGFLTLILALSLSFETLGFLMVNLVTALAVILSARHLRQRKDVFVVCGKGWLCCIVVLLAMHLYQQDDHFFSNLFSSAFFMVLTAILVVGLLPLLESSFRIMTDVTLMEYMNPNNDLLRRLAIEAPGTYQHSVSVGGLAESAALAVGANGLFCRVATLYHDIGKVVTPQYFTENQQAGVDLHQLLTPQESAQVIAAHVIEGVKIARKAGLPEPFVDVIKEHHGTTLIYYFYRKELERVGGDKSLVDESLFRYGGPTPFSKESGIIMIVDSIEAASRSLDQIDEQSLRELADQTIRYKLEDGQFDRCQLTCAELSIVKKMVVETLLAAQHGRIKYPTRESEQERVDI